MRLLPVSRNWSSRSGAWSSPSPLVNSVVSGVESVQWPTCPSAATSMPSRTAWMRASSIAPSDPLGLHSTRSYQAGHQAAAEPLVRANVPSVDQFAVGRQQRKPPLGPRAAHDSIPATLPVKFVRRDGAMPGLLQRGDTHCSR